MAKDSQNIQILIEDHVVPQLLTSAIEAYQHGDVTTKSARLRHKQETFGLLWGYILPERVDTPTRIVAVMSTVEVSADRRRDSVEPLIESIKQKREFFEKFWPNLELVGTFHSHPYKNLEDIEGCQGWRASGGDGDTGYWPYLHAQVCSEYEHLAHLIVSVVGLDRRSSKWPIRIENNTGYTLGAGNYRLWIKGYVTSKSDLHFNIHEGEDGNAIVDEGAENYIPSFGYQVGTNGQILDDEDEPMMYDDIEGEGYIKMVENIELQIPSLQNRFSEHIGK